MSKWHELQALAQAVCETYRRQVERLGYNRAGVLELLRQRLGLKDD